jgi:hypothetical protein
MNTKDWHSIGNKNLGHFGRKTNALDPGTKHGTKFYL